MAAAVPRVNVYSMTDSGTSGKPKKAIEGAERWIHERSQANRLTFSASLTDTNLRCCGPITTSALMTFSEAAQSIGCVATRIDFV